MTKQEARLLMKQRLGQFDPGIQARASAAICQRVIALPEFQQARSVLLFAPLAGEPDIGPVFDSAFNQSKNVAIPSAETHSGRLRLWRVPTRADMQDGKHGRPRLIPDHGILVDGAGCDFALVPGLAFNRQGVRLGRGGGYFDRLLQQLGPETLRVGCIFFCQELTDLHHESHDQLLDWIVTEKECIQVVT
jgi:5-formyltetrahydrofolate cyclo-ligase